MSVCTMPPAFNKRMGEHLVDSIPLGTLEWHGLHNVMGVDGLQSDGIFTRAAKRFGGNCVSSSPPRTGRKYLDRYGLHYYDQAPPEAGGELLLGPQRLVPDDARISAKLAGFICLLWAWALTESLGANGRAVGETVRYHPALLGH
jgi:creatinine amidohydrolase